MSSPWARWLVFAAVTIVVIVAVSVAIVAFGGRSVAIDYYRVVDDRELVIGVTGGKGSWPRASVDEEQGTVIITANLFEWGFGLPQTAVGIPLEAKVTLEQPLDDRVVVDGSNGSEPVQTRCGWPTYRAPECVVRDGSGP